MNNTLQMSEVGSRLDDEEMADESTLEVAEQSPVLFSISAGRKRKKFDPV